MHYLRICACVFCEVFFGLAVVCQRTGQQCRSEGNVVGFFFLRVVSSVFMHCNRVLKEDEMYQQIGS